MTFEKKLAKHLKIAVKISWRHGNNGVKVRVPEGELEREEGTFATTDTQKAEVLNQFFTSVFYHRRQGKYAKNGGKARGKHST